ncbi:hypothetical protein BGY98DRAFT_999394 [Russula aff. rugulosa BPL654]|nr:hypothetical protein BGY98DRAFT_999394 [Russula aff. rugulosa BPL654]
MYLCHGCCAHASAAVPLSFTSPSSEMVSTTRTNSVVACCCHPRAKRKGMSRVNVVQSVCGMKYVWCSACMWHI